MHLRWRRHVWRPALLVAALALGGCLQTRSLLTVRPDGSATLVETVTMSEMMRLWASGLDSTATAAPDRAALEARAASFGPGVTFTGLVETADGYEATFAVADVRTLRLTLPDGPQQGSRRDSLAAPFTFAFAPGAGGAPHRLDVTVPVPPPQAPAAEQTPEERAQGLAMARALFADAHVSFHIAVEGTPEGTPEGELDASGRLAVLDLPVRVLFDLMIEHPDLAESPAVPLERLAALTAGRDDVRVRPPGTVSVRFR